MIQETYISGEKKLKNDIMALPGVINVSILENEIIVAMDSAITLQQKTDINNFISAAGYVRRA